MPMRHGCLPGSSGMRTILFLREDWNYWFGNILSAQAPSQTSPNEEFAKYDFRKSAATALGGSGVVATEGASTAAKAAKPTVTAKAKKKPAGGC